MRIEAHATHAHLGQLDRESEAIARQVQLRFNRGVVREAIARFGGRDSGGEATAFIRGAAASLKAAGGALAILSRDAGTELAFEPLSRAVRRLNHAARTTKQAVERIDHAPQSERQRLQEARSAFLEQLADYRACLQWESDLFAQRVPLHKCGGLRKELAEAWSSIAWLEENAR